jgi:hypothetical protein
MLKQNLVEITCTQPRQILQRVQVSPQRPSFMSILDMWIAIDPCEPPFVPVIVDVNLSTLASQVNRSVQKISDLYDFHKAGFFGLGDPRRASQFDLQLTRRESDQKHKADRAAVAPDSSEYMADYPSQQVID